MSPKKSPKKRVKTVLVTDDDKDVKRIVDRSHEKEALKKCEQNERQMNGDSDDTDIEDSVSPTKSKSIETDNYFMCQSVRAKTSKNSFAKVLQNFDLSEDAIKDIIDDQFADERRYLLDSYSKNKSIDKWFHLLKCGFNVCLYGVGSKRKLLDLFVSQWLQTDHHIVIQGFDNQISLKHITSALSQVVNEIINDETRLIDKLEEIDFDLFLAIHSIDLLLATHPKIRWFLNKLVAKCKHLRIIATVDHINSGLLWSTTESDLYNWLWFSVPTFESYSVEKAFSTGLSVMSSSSKSWNQSVTYNSVKHVYDSLTSNAQKIYLLILTNYIETKDPNNGFAFSDCYTVCREEFLVNSEMTLRAQISEFKDHKLLKLKKGSDGGEVIVVCVDKTVAQKFIDNHK